MHSSADLFKFVLEGITSEHNGGLCVSPDRKRFDAEQTYGRYLAWLSNPRCSPDTVRFQYSVAEALAVAWDDRRRTEAYGARETWDLLRMHNEAVCAAAKDAALRRGIELPDLSHLLP